MSEIVERSLKLTVQGEDLTEALFGDLASRLDELQSRAESAFSAISAAARASVAEMESSIGEAPAFWQDQLQAVADTAGVAFAEVTDAAMMAADSVASSATQLTEPLASIAASADVAMGKVAAAFDAATLAVDGDVTRIDGALSDLSGTFEGVAGSADGLDAKIKGALDSAVGAVEGDVGKMSDSLASLGNTAGGAIDEKLKAAMDGAVTVVDESVGKMNDSLANIGDGMASTFDGRVKLTMDGAVGTVEVDAKKMADALAGVGLGGIEGAAGAGAGAGAVVAGGGKEKGAASTVEKDIANTLKKDEENLFKKLGRDITAGAKNATAGVFAGAGGKLALGGIGVSLLTPMMDYIANAIENTAGMQLLGGGKHPMTPQQALMLTQVMGAAGLPAQQIPRLISKLETSIFQGTGALQTLSSNNPLAQALQLGQGRLAASPSTAMINPSQTEAILFALMGLTPAKLQQMNALQQLSALSGGLQKLQTQSARTAAEKTLLGGMRGQGIQNMELLLAKFPEFLQATMQAEGGAIGNFKLPANADIAAAKLRASGQGLSLTFQDLAVHLIPALTGLTKEIVRLTDWLEKGTGGLAKAAGNVPGGRSVLQTVESNPLESYLGYRVGKKLVTTLLKSGDKSGASLIRNALSKLGGGAEKTIYADLGGTSTGLGMDVLSKALGPIGVGLGVLANPASVASDTSAWAKMWQTVVAPHVNQKGFTQADSIKAIREAAHVFGLDEKAMLSASFAESGLRPWAVGPRVPGRGNARGIFQFMPSTWAADTKRYLGQSLSVKEASNPYVAAMIAAAQMAHIGIGKMHGTVALRNIIGDLPGVTAAGGAGFEHPGAKGAASDMSRALPFFAALGKAGSTADLAKPVDQALEKIVQSALKHSKSFDAETRKMLVEAERYLKAGKDPFAKAGEDLLKGLEQGLTKEMPHLKAEVRKIAKELEQTLRAATGTHSPSEMFAAIGSDLAAGLLLGYQRKMPAVLAGVGGSLGGLHGAATAGGNITVLNQNLHFDGVTDVNKLADLVHQRTYALVKMQGSIG